MTLRFDFRRYRLPMRVAVKTAHGLWSEREGVIVRLTNEQGGAGFGEAAPIPWFGTETTDEVEAACRELGVRVDETRLAAVPVKLGCLRNALAAAGRALASARAGRSETGSPAERRREADSASYLGIAALLPAGRAALREIATRSEAGFRVFKWKVGVGDPADELALLDDVCAELPEGGKLRLDANGAWDRRVAQRWFERCADRPVEFIEQPAFAPTSEGATHARRIEDLLFGLAGDYPTPIALDESLVGDGDVGHWLAAGWPGVFVVKPSLLGDADGALAKLAAAKATVVFSSALETAVGAREGLRRAFAWTGERRALGFGVWPLFADARFNGPAAVPFLRREDVERLDPEAAWNALS